MLEIVFLTIAATAGHAMALLWFIAGKQQWKICQTVIYDISFGREQLSRELKNSIHTPIHAVFLSVLVYFGFFDSRTLLSFCLSLLLIIVWAEIWHYFSHRAFHLKSLHWIHAEHHRSRINTPFSAISFSFTEKLIFDIGMLLPLVVLDFWWHLNFFAIAAWFIGYLLINSFSHANFEFRASSYNRHIGKILTTTAYHSLHHSRYTGNYGLGTRVLDRYFDTEWKDYEAVYDRICSERSPLSKLRERID